jgi:hypothetical protein
VVGYRNYRGVFYPRNDVRKRGIGVDRQNRRFTLHDLVVRMFSLSIVGRVGMHGNEISILDRSCDLRYSHDQLWVS